MTNTRYALKKLYFLNGIYISIYFKRNLIFLFIGCDLARRDGVVDYLNDLYQRSLKQKKLIFDTYCHIVKNNPYRVLASYSYDWKESPLRSNRIAAIPLLTDAGSGNESTVSNDRTVLLPSPLRSISNITDHKEYIQLLINGKTTASLNKCQTPVIWRGYTTTIDPNFNLTRENVRDKLLSALQKIRISEVEQKVRK